MGHADRNLPFADARIPLWVAIAICAFGIAWRVWGASYLGAAIVFDSAIVTDALYVSGPYRRTRNPLYFGLNCYALGIALIGPWLTVAIVACGIVALDEALIASEERRLRVRFGDRFDAFVRAVPRLFPSLLPRVPDDGLHPSLVVGLRAELPVIALAVASFAFTSMHR